MEIREVKSTERFEFGKLQAAAFNFTINEQSKDDDDRTDRIVLGAYDGDTLMAAIVVIDYECYMFGKKYKASGIAGVATFPQYRRRGCIRELFKYSLNRDYNNNTEYSFLYPFSFRYYRKFGYERAFSFYTIELPTPTLAHIPRADAEVYNDKEKLPELCELYNQYASKHNCCFHRDDDRYFNCEPHKCGEYVYICRKDGVPCSLAKVTTEGRTLLVHELVYKDNSSLLQILGFLRSYEGQMDRIRFLNLPCDSPLSLVIDSDRGSSYGTGDGAMGRVVNAEHALERYDYSKDGSFTVGINDNSVPQNNGIYRVCRKNGCVSVEKGDFTPDFELDDTCMSRLLLGDCEGENISFLCGDKFYNKDSDALGMFAKHSGILFERF